MSGEALGEPVAGMDSLTIPAVEALRTTYTAMQRTVTTISAGCRTVAQTLEVLDDALHVVTQGSKPGQEWGSFGVVGLPVVGALRAVKGIASQHVEQQTGVPLATWTDLVASSSAQFGAYVARLDSVAELSERYQASTEREIDLEQALRDREVLLDVSWQTQVWKQVLSRVAQLGQVVEAILEVDFGEEPGGSELAGPERPSGLSGSLQRRLKDVQSRTVERSGAFGEWVLRPFVEVRDTVRQLPEQVHHLAHEVTLLEVLLDLQVAQIRACVGEISPTEARIVGMRVAVGVVLLELARDLQDARQRAQRYETYLDRLSGTRNAGEVDDRAYSILSEEYRTGLESSRSHLAALEAQADVWRRDGRSVLEACADWAKLELDVLAVRRVVEDDVAADDRGARLRRERDRLDQARTILASL